MALVNTAKRELHCKIVYYGPGLAGKTTNLQHIHWQLPVENRGELLSTATETERSVFFQCHLPHLAQVQGCRVVFHIYTVPGCILYARTRYNVLIGTDGVVFVANSQKAHLLNNIDRLKELELIIAHQVPNISAFPLVLQYNKRDRSDVLSVEQLNHHLNQHQWPWFEASAAEGEGVIETFQVICERVFENVQAPAEERVPSLQRRESKPILSSAQDEQAQKKVRWKWWK